MGGCFMGLLLALLSEVDVLPATYVCVRRRQNKHKSKR